MNLKLSLCDIHADNSLLTYGYGTYSREVESAG
jgi:hypothetical protein